MTKFIKIFDKLITLYYIIVKKNVIITIKIIIVKKKIYINTQDNNNINNEITVANKNCEVDK